MKTRISIVMPVLDEAANIAASLASLESLRSRGVELIVVDGGSSDATVRLAGPQADRVVAAPRGRARQMNAGATLARGDVIVFLHADTLLPPDADHCVASAVALGAVWGRFDVRIAGRPRMLRVVGLMMNLRSRLGGIATGDQAIFVRRDVLERIGGIPDQPLMEDVELSRRLLRIAAPACLRARVVTSGRRWETHGVWRTIVLMWRLRWRYWRGESPQELAQAYR